MSDPTITQLRVFLVVAQKGSMSAAAIELDLTQSAISHAVHVLERQLGVTLFERHGRGVRTTTMGDTLRPLAQQVVGQMGLLLHAAANGTSLTGVVRIATFSSLARHLMPQALQQLAQRHPALSVQLDDNHNERMAVIRAVKRGQADIGLTQLLPDSSLSAHALGQDPYVLLIPESWTLHDLWQRPYVHLGGRDDVWLTDMLARYGVKLNSILNLSNEAAILALVSSGVGFTILPQLALLDLPPNVVQYPLPYAVERTYGTVIQLGTPPPHVSAVLKLLWNQREDERH